MGYRVEDCGSSTRSVNGFEVCFERVGSPCAAKNDNQRMQMPGYQTFATVIYMEFATGIFSAADSVLEVLRANLLTRSLVLALRVGKRKRDYLLSQHGL